MEEKDYKKLKTDGILFQMNLLSLTGAYGELAKKKAEWLISKDMVDLLGTDVHNLMSIKNCIGSKVINKKLFFDLLNKNQSFIN